MTVRFRAIWADDRPDLLEQCHRLFAAWVDEKSHGQIAVPGVGDVCGPVYGRRPSRRGLLVDDEVRRGPIGEGTVHVERRSDPGADVDEVLRMSLVENRHDGSRWTTLIQAWTGHAARRETAGGGWTFVDVEAVTHGSLHGVTVAAPRVVRSLIGQGMNPRRDQLTLTTVPRPYRGSAGAERLAELITIDRDLPVIVLADSDGHDVELAGKVAAMSAGIAVTCRVDAEARAGLTDVLGPDYGVGGLELRVFQPGADPALSDGWKHRVFPLLVGYRAALLHHGLVMSVIGAQAATRRAPRSHDAAVALLHRERRTVRDLEELLGGAEQELATERAQASLEQGRYLELLDDHERLQEETERLRRRLEEALRTDRASTAGSRDTTGTAVADDPAMIPSTALSVSDAVALARAFLSDRVRIPDDAVVDLADLDAAVESRSWGQKVWDAMRALHAYAAAMDSATDPGSFWVWCETSRHPRVWPATAKKLAMRESQSVMTDGRLRAHRVLPVDRAVEADGRVLMEAHIKIAEGGGHLAPRIYFLPDRRNGRVHVGFVGPHRHMPNTRT